MRTFRKEPIEQQLYLPEIDISVLLNQKDDYSLEYVADIEARHTAIYNEHGFDYTQKDKGARLGKVIGRYMRLGLGDSIKHFILIDRNLKPSKIVDTICHEYGHFIWAISQQDLIYNKLNNPDLVKSKIKDTHDFAFLCGYLGLSMAGHDLNNFKYDVVDKNQIDKRELQKQSVLEHYLPASN